MKSPARMTDEEIKYALSDIRTTVAVSPYRETVERYRDDWEALEVEQQSRDRKRIWRDMRRKHVHDPLCVPIRQRRWVNNTAYHRDRLRTANFSLAWLEAYGL